MSNFMGSIWWLIVSIGILVTFHEFGHFWVARRLGVHVIRFSVGFGKPLWSRLGRDGTEYAIAAIPLGGYVKMLDEREFEVPDSDLHKTFNRKPVLQRMAIVIAGPAFNFLLCFVLLWAMFVIGKPDYLPIVGRADGIAAQAGFQPGERVLSIDGTDTPTWAHAELMLVGAAQDRRDAQVEVERPDGGRAQRILPLQRLGAGQGEAQMLGAIGLVPRQFLLPPVIGSISTDGPRDVLHPGDRILRVGATPIDSFDQIGPALKHQAHAGEPLRLRIARNGQATDVMIVPKLRAVGDGSQRLSIGITAQARDAAYDTVRRYGPIAALGVSAHETWRLTSESLGMLWRMASGHANLSGVSGPIAIAQYANASAQMGVAWFLFFLAILSLSLGIMNLLPIPILDGGHLLYYLIELVKGSPVSERTLAMGQYIGLALLGALMCLAFYNDILRQFS
jgi:regulator of sigma E protease